MQDVNQEQRTGRRSGSVQTTLKGQNAITWQPDNEIDSQPGHQHKSRRLGKVKKHTLSVYLMKSIWSLYLFVCV